MFCSSVAEAVHALLDAQRVVLDVAQVAALLVVHAGQLDQPRRGCPASGFVARWNSITSRVSS